jgi:hypothetical protein
MKEWYKICAGFNETRQLDFVSIEEITVADSFSVFP